MFKKIYSQGIYVWYIVEVYNIWNRWIKFLIHKEKITSRFWLKDILITFWYILYLVREGAVIINPDIFYEIKYYRTIQIIKRRRKNSKIFNTGLCLQASDNYNNLLIDFSPSPPHRTVPIKINYNSAIWSLASVQMCLSLWSVFSMCCPINLNGSDSQQIPGVLYERKSQTGSYRGKSFYMCFKAYLCTTLMKNWCQWKHLTIEVKAPQSFFVAVTEGEEMNYNWDIGKLGTVLVGSDSSH